LKWLLVAPLAVALHSCHQPMPTSDFCNVANRTIYVGGDWKFTDDELAHLTRMTKEKLVALKRTYKEICLN
jgi:hypothetical protein